MMYEKKLIDIGGSQGFILPLDLCKYLDINVGDDIVIQDDKGKHGRFISILKIDKYEWRCKNCEKENDIEEKICVCGRKKTT